MLVATAILVALVAVIQVAWSMGHRSGRTLEQRRFREHLAAEFRLMTGREPEILRVDDDGFTIESMPRPALPAAFDQRSTGTMRRSLPAGRWMRWRPKDDDPPPPMVDCRCSDEPIDPIDDPDLWRELEERVAAQERVATIVPKGSPVNECPHCRTVGHTDPACPIRARLV